VHPIFLFILVALLAMGLIFAVGPIPEVADEIKKETKKKKHFRSISTGIALSGFLACLVWVYYSGILDIKELRSPINEISLSKDGNQIKCAINIGSTSSTLFYWDIVSSQSVIIPKNRITKIKVVLIGPPKKRSCGIGGCMKQYSRKDVEGNRKLLSINAKYEEDKLFWKKEIENKCY